MLRSVILGVEDAERLRRGARAAPGVHWVRFGDRELVWAEETAGDALDTAAAHRGTAGVATVRGRPYLVGQVGRSFQNENPGARVLLEKGRYLVVDLTAEELAALGTAPEILLDDPAAPDRPDRG